MAVLPENRAAVSGAGTSRRAFSQDFAATMLPAVNDKRRQRGREADREAVLSGTFRRGRRLLFPDRSDN